MRYLWLAAALAAPIATAAIAQPAPAGAGMKDMPMEGMAMSGPAADGMIHGEGKVVALDPSNGRITISHEPIAVLKWPAMAMGFNAAGDLQAGLKPGQRVTFCIVPDGSAYRITMMTGH